MQSHSHLRSIGNSPTRMVSTSMQSPNHHPSGQPQQQQQQQQHHIHHQTHHPQQLLITQHQQQSQQSLPITQQIHRKTPPPLPPKGSSTHLLMSTGHSTQLLPNGQYNHSVHHQNQHGETRPSVIESNQAPIIIGCI